MGKSLLIAFSGLDGAGKSTQINLLREYLDAQGHKTRYLWARGGYTPLFSKLKNIARRTSHGKLVPQSGHSVQRSRILGHPSMRRLWLILAILDLMGLYVLQLRWWRWSGKTVICDRYIWDTYIDFRLNFPEEQIERWWLWQLLTNLCPQLDTAFLLTVPVAESLRRSRLKQEPFPDTRDILKKRLALYRCLSEQGHWLVLEGDRPINELAARIRTVICSIPPDA